VNQLKGGRLTRIKLRGQTNQEVEDDEHVDQRKELALWLRDPRDPLHNPEERLGFYGD